MKKMLCLVLSSVFLFTGCMEQEINKTIDIPHILDDNENYNVYVGYDAEEELGYRYEAIFYLRTFMEQYSAVIDNEVTYFNSIGGASGQLYVLGNRAVDEYNAAVEYWNNTELENMDVTEFANLLIKVRNTLREVGFID